MSDCITDLGRGPRRVTLGGREFLAREARLVDLRTIQEWLDDQSPDTTDEMVKSLEGLDQQNRDRVLLEAWDAADERLSFDESEGQDRVLRTLDGLTFFLGVAMENFDPKAILDATPKEIARIRRVFFGVRPHSLIRRLFGADGAEQGGEPVTWAEAILGVCRDYGWTLDYVWGLTLTEFRLARTGGKVEPERLPATQEIQDRITQARFGVSAEEHFGSMADAGSPPQGEGSASELLPCDPVPLPQGIQRVLPVPGLPSEPS